MKSLDLLEALGEVNQKYLIEAQKNVLKNEKTIDSENVVMEVEVINKTSVWKYATPIISVAAVFMLIVGVTLHISKRNDFTKKEYNSVTESSMVTDEKDDLNTINLLELHINMPPVYTVEQVDALIDNGIDEYKRNQREKISVDNYISKLKEQKYDSNSPELKTYIYHMMLNSVDYYNNAEGSMTYAMNLKSPIDIYFQTDIAKGLSYEKETEFNKPVNEFYVSDKMLYTIDLTTQKYTEQVCASTVEFIISDNERVVMLDNGEKMSISRNDITNLGVSGNSCLFPQSYAMSYLCDFDNWKLGKIVDSLGRKCVEVVGKNQNQYFIMLVDIDTGIMMKHEVYDESDNLTAYVKVNSISIDSDLKVFEFDKNQYIME